MKGLIFRKRAIQVPLGRCLGSPPLVDASLQAQDCTFLCTGMSNDLWAYQTKRRHWQFPREMPYFLSCLQIT